MTCVNRYSEDRRRTLFRGIPLLPIGDRLPSLRPGVKEPDEVCRGPCPPPPKNLGSTWVNHNPNSETLPCSKPTKTGFLSSFSVLAVCLFSRRPGIVSLKFRRMKTRDGACRLTWLIISKEQSLWAGGKYAHESPSRPSPNRLSSDTIPSALFHANQTVYPVSAKAGRFPSAGSGYGRTTAA